MTPRLGGWRVELVRDDAAGSRSLRLREPRVLGLSILVLSGLAACLVTIGFLLGARQRGARNASLEERLAAADAQAEQIRELAVRLERAESNYRQLRQIMGAETAASGQDIRLPELPGAVRERGSLDVADTLQRRLPTSWPVARRGFVSRTFESDASGPLGEHRGVDIALPTGSYVRASGDGVVKAAGEDSVYGLFVRLAHEDGVESLYAHNSWLFVAEGDSVEQNEVLALSGNTGQSSAPHLHFEIEKDGSAVDPATFITGAR